MLLMAASACACVVVGVRLTGSWNASAMLVYALACLLGLLVEAVSFAVFAVERPQTRFGQADGALFLKVLCASAVGALVLEALTLAGAPAGSLFLLQDWNAKRLCVFFALAYCAILFVLLRPTRPHACPLLAAFSRTMARAGVAVVAAIVLSIAFSLAAGALGGLSVASSFIFFFAASLSLLAIFACRGDVASHPERPFLVVSLLVGVCISLSMPAVGVVSWDDETHYKRSLALSYVVDSEYTDADMVLITPLAPSESVDKVYAGPSWDGSWSASRLYAYNKQLDELYKDGPTYATSGFETAPPATSNASYSTLGYIPSAIGLWLGRLLHLPFALIAFMGRLFNLLSYSIVCYFAIKVIPVKKNLLAAVALLPTSLFLASNYSYDPWVTSFLLLAVALVTREACEKGSTITCGRWCLILFVFFLALGPKAIYFPLVALMLLIPKERFESGRQRAALYGAAVAVVVVATLSFVLPMLVSSGVVATDTRGGLDVSSSGQIAGILSDPLGFLATMLSFLFNDYLTVGSSDGYITSFAYLGDLSKTIPALGGVGIVYLVAVALTDSDRRSMAISSVSRAAYVFAVLFVTVFLVAASLYVSFTPVGYGSVLGCQPRYLLPLVFPALAFCLNLKVENRTDKKAYGRAVLLLSSLLSFACVWFLITSRIVL